jgi:hypothetical protein
VSDWRGPVRPLRLLARRRVLAAAAVLETVTGLVLMIDPIVVVRLLLGADVSGQRMPLGRVAGIALLALGLACWPGDQAADGGGPAFRAMLTYNVLITLYLAYLGIVGHLAGLLLWPAVAVHAALSVGLLCASGGGPGARATGGVGSV